MHALCMHLTYTSHALVMHSACTWHARNMHLVLQPLSYGLSYATPPTSHSITSQEDIFKRFASRGEAVIAIKLHSTWQGKRVQVTKHVLIHPVGFSLHMCGHF